MRAILLAIAGCSQQPAFDTDVDWGSDGDADVDADADTDTDTDTLPFDDVWSGLDAEHCENVDGREDWEGATGYFIGELTGGSGSWSGTETWLLFATSEWEDVGGGDCQVVWDVTGNEVGTKKCSSCDYGLAITATLDAAESDCSEALYAGDEQYEVTYDIEISGNGDATFYFASSGNLLGEGYGNGGRLAYVTAPTCHWF